MSTTEGPGPELSRRLAYLLKHAQFLMHELSEKALAPFGVNGRELGVLLVLTGREPGSQQQAAQRLGVEVPRPVSPELAPATTPSAGGP